MARDLSEVRELTCREGAIAARMDLTHAEKIELIRPLRMEREAAANARYERPFKVGAGILATAERACRGC